MLLLSFGLLRHQWSSDLQQAIGQSRDSLPQTFRFNTVAAAALRSIHWPLQCRNLVKCMRTYRLGDNSYGDNVAYLVMLGCYYSWEHHLCLAAMICCRLTSCCHRCRLVVKRSDCSRSGCSLLLLHPVLQKQLFNHGTLWVLGMEGGCVVVKVFMLHRFDGRSDGRSSTAHP